MQPAGQVGAVEDQDQEKAAAQARRGADRRLAQQQAGNRARSQPAGSHERDSRHGEEDGDGIVGAGLQLQDRTGAPPQLHPAGAQQEEHRRGIGRGHDRAQQETLHGIQAQEVMRRDAGEPGGDHHAGGRQHQRRREQAAIGGEARAQAAVEQDDAERQRADKVGEAIIGKSEPARPILARQHADAEEDQQHGGAEARRDQARQDAGDDERGAQQQDGIGGVDRVHVFPYGSRVRAARPTVAGRLAVAGLRWDTCRMKTARNLIGLATLLWAGAGHAETYKFDSSMLPNPAGCANYQEIGGGVPDDACNQAIARETDPGAKSVLLFRRAFIEDAPGDFSKYGAALDDLGLAIKLFPGNWPALRERAYIYVEYGRWSEALADLDAQIALFPKDAAGYRERAIPRFKLGDLQGAYDDRDADIRLGGEDSAGLLARARAAMWLGRFDDASRDIAAAGASEDATKLQHMLTLWTTTSGPDAAKKCVFDEKLGDDKNLIGDCTRAFLDAKKPAEQSGALTTRAQAWLVLQHDEGASILDREIAVGLDPTNAGALSNLGFTYMQSRHSTAAAAMFDRSIAIAPAFYNYAGRAAARFNLADLDGAEADARKSNEFRRNDIALTILGDVAFARTKTYDKAKDFWIAAYDLGGRDDGLIGRLKDAGVPIPPPGSGSAP